MITYIINITLLLNFVIMGIGDWGLGIAQSPIPNPQSPIIQYNAK